MTSPQLYSGQTYRNRAFGFILALLLIRLIALALSPYNLHGDEAQYWAWAQDLDWGYFSKPPMIAWLIAATTAIFGDAEWAVRLTSPLLHSGTAVFIFLTGRKAFSARAGFWACAVYMLMPAVWVSSMIISTDAALLFFWSAALYAWMSLRETQAWRFALLLGVAIGLGLMSKYAMMFFIPPLMIAALYDKPSKAALLGAKGLAIACIAAVIIAPNIWWNTAHDFATFSHTAANTNLADKTNFFHPLEFLGFFRDQFGVFGPMPFILLLGLLGGIIKLIITGGLKRRAALETPPNLFIYLTVFTLTPLIIISVQAVLSRANANWAVTAYPSAALLLGASAIHITSKKDVDKNKQRKRWLSRGLLMQSLFCSFLLVLSLFPNAVNKLGVANSVKRLRAWPQTIELIETRFAQGHEDRDFTSIIIDSRIIFYDAEYYGLRRAAPIYMWRKTPTPQNHAELIHAFTKQKAASKQAPVLLLNYHQDSLESFKQDFARVEPLAPIQVDLGGGKTRRLKAWAAYGYRPQTKR